MDADFRGKTKGSTWMLDSARTCVQCVGSCDVTESSVCFSYQMSNTCSCGEDEWRSQDERAMPEDSGVLLAAA